MKGDIVMKNRGVPFNVIWGPLKFIGKHIGNIFRYLACYEYETSDARMSLRNLYNSGQIDEGKYHRFRKQCRNDSYDPEEIEKPM